MANESKKFALFACCLMTMQALRLVISTAGFCVVRFHIDCSLFNIFISRLVNAVLMSQLFGNWLGDLIVFAASGQLKLYAIALSNWAEFICFCSALGCICAGEQGHLTGFYLSMVSAYFWWKVGEAPATSIGGTVVDWYFAGFTLSGVWAAILKGVVMMFIFEAKGVHSDVLGEVNVTVVGDVSLVGSRSVKTTVDYRAAKWLFATTIMVTFLMCVLWDVISESVDNEGSDHVLELLQKAAHTAFGTANDNKLLEAIKNVSSKEVNVQSSSTPATLNFTNATVDKVDKAPGPTQGKIEITLGGVTASGQDRAGAINSTQPQTTTTADKVKEKMEGLLGPDKIAKVELSGSVKPRSQPLELTIKVTVDVGRKRVINELQAAARSKADGSPGGTATDNKLLDVLKQANVTWQTASGPVEWGNARVLASNVKAHTTDPTQTKIQIVVTLKNAKNEAVKDTGDLKTALEKAIGPGKIAGVTGDGDGAGQKLTLSVTVTNDVKNTGRELLMDELKMLASTKEADNSNNRLAKALRAVGVVSKPGATEAKFNAATVELTGVKRGKTDNTIEITVKGLTNSTKEHEDKIKDHAKTQLALLIGAERIAKVTLSGQVPTSSGSQPFALTVTVTVAAGIDWVLSEFHRAASSGDFGAPGTPTANTLLTAIKNGANGQTVNVGGPAAELNFDSAEVAVDGSGVKKNSTKADVIMITVNGVQGVQPGQSITSTGDKTLATAENVKQALAQLIGGAQIDDFNVKPESSSVTITIASGATGRVGTSKRFTVSIVTGLVVGAIFAAPGALLLSGLAKFCKKTAAASTLRWWAITGMILGGAAATAGFVVSTNTKTLTEMTEVWVDKYKWETPEQNMKTWAAMIGLLSGMVVGALVGLIIGSCTGSTKSGTAGGAFIGGFVGIISGEITNGAMTWQGTNFLQAPNKPWVLGCGLCIVVFGLGTVYSIYPGMAPCSITQFKYFNIIDIWILILSAIAPIVIMLVDLTEQPWRLAMVILGKGEDPAVKDGTVTKGDIMKGAIGTAVVMTIATNICEIIVICVLQYPHSKTAQQVTTSGWRACTLTILMVAFQLTSTGIGFACVGAGSGLNVGWMNVNSTAVLWTTECCGVLGEGYMTELKKYEPGKWPTQGMGKWSSYWWWNGKAFRNAWAIWCCIGTTDLRRDIMLCRK